MHDNEYLLGSFMLEVDDEFLNEVSLPGYSKGVNIKVLGYVNIEVYGNEGDYEYHFHVKGAANTKGRMNRIDTCFYLFKPNYFDHGVHNTTGLPQKVLNQLDNFLREDNPKEKSKSNWQVLI